MSDAKTPFTSPEPIDKRLGDKKTLVILGVVIVVLALVLIGLWVIGSRGGTSVGVVPPALKLTKDVSEVKLQEEYRNPFDRNSQYVNPFKESKSPFQALQQ